MRSLLAFIKKEAVEQIRSGRFLILVILFTLFGIMNPAVAKLTPWLLEVMSDSLAEAGMNITVVSVTALDSWVQFYKNIPMALIVFVLMQSNLFTKEYQSGTLVLSLTKGLGRYKVVLAKTMVLTVLWTVLYWLNYAITYAYTVYFWDQSVVKNLPFSATCYWVFGLWVIALTILFSTLASANTGVLVGTGAVVFVSYLVSMIPKVGDYLPIKLGDGTSLIYGALKPEDYVAALIVTAATGIACLVASVPVFNKKRL